MFNIADTKAVQAANKKTGGKNNNENTGSKTFSNIYMRFESIQDCAFSAEVTFPEEEKYQMRKRQAEQQSENLFQRNAINSDDEILDEDDLLM